MRYIDKVIHEIAYEMATKELNRINRLKWFLLGTLVGMIFWFVIFLEFYCLAPCK